MPPEQTPVAAALAPVPGAGASAVAPGAAAPGAATGSRAGGSAPAAGRAPMLRSFLRALLDRETYELKGNPPLWLGFLMALPIPILVGAAGGATWLLLLSVAAPFFWGTVLGAAGRVAVLAEVAAERLTREVEQERTKTAATAASLDEEVHRRERLEKLEKAVIEELTLAAAIHQTLLPGNITRPDVEVAVRQIASQYVGGDYLYAAVAGDRYLYLAVGDVTGHGVSAALVVARLHGLMRRLTLAMKSRPVTILEQVNAAALEVLQHTWFFLTMAVFRLDLQTGHMRYATAGHPAQVLLRRDGRMERLRTPNRLLGLDADVFDDQRPQDGVWLQPGDTLVLFTDGLYEILSGQDGKMLGEAGLHERISSLRGLAPSLLAGEVLQDVADYQGRGTFQDDVSLMVATWRGPPDDADAEPPEPPLVQPT